MAYLGFVVGVAVAYFVLYEREWSQNAEENHAAGRTTECDRCGEILALARENAIQR
jgi:hypothetical protein